MHNKLIAAALFEHSSQGRWRMMGENFFCQHLQRRFHDHLQLSAAKRFSRFIAHPRTFLLLCA
jgi:hypothetical protein